MLVGWCALETSVRPVPTIRFEQEGQQVGCIEGANLRKAALMPASTPTTVSTTSTNCSGVGQCGTCVMEVVEGQSNLSPAVMLRRFISLIAQLLPPQLPDHGQW
ncbi:MAG: hypothetical protein CM15mP77_3200 [Synechococcus sp.]|nr:MAG: hypothetical protein CM15mP77_3200 [Synechococcus sp.]